MGIGAGVKYGAFSYSGYKKREKPAVFISQSSMRDLMRDFVSPTKITFYRNLKNAPYNIMNSLGIQNGQTLKVSDICRKIAISEGNLNPTDKQIKDIRNKYFSQRIDNTNFYNANKSFMTRAMAKDSVPLNAADTNFYNANETTL